ncbi:MAG: ParB/RepB/Spo0J family partition protein [Desulfohalobiaceae bacterium]
MPASGRLFTVSPFDVDASGDWLFWAEAPEEKFLQSIRELGQLEPVLVAQDEGGPSLLAGYRRLLACRELGLELLALSTGSPNPAHRGRIYAESNRQRQPDAADLVRAGRYFASHLDAQGLDAVLLELSASEGGKRMPDLVRTWLRLDPEWDGLLRAGHLPIQAAEILSRLNSADAAELWPFFRDLRWSRNNALQFLGWLEETASRERTSLAQLIRFAEMHLILESDLSPKDRIRRLVQKAWAMRYPRLTDLEAEFSAMAREASRAGPWRISPEASFESDRIHLSASIGSGKDLERAARELERLHREGLLERLLQWQRNRLGGSTEEESPRKDTE